MRDLPAVIEALDEAGADVVHLHYPSRGFGYRLGPALLPLLLRLRGHRARPVVTLHEFRRAHPLRKAVGLLATLPADAVVLPNRAGKGLLGRLRGRRPTYVLPCGATRSSDEPSAAPIPGRLFHYGHAVPTKGLEVLIRSLDRLRRRHPSVSLELACAESSELRRLRRLVEERGLAKHVIWRGWLRDGELRRAAARAEVLVFPFTDGFSLERSSVLNLLGCGTPVVTTRGRPPLPLVACEPDSEESLASCLDDLLERLGSPAGAGLRADLARLQRSLAAHFSFARVAEAHAAIYRSVLQDAARSGREAEAPRGLRRAGGADETSRLPL